MDNPHVDPFGRTRVVLSPALTTVLIAAGATIALTGVYFASGIFGPLLLGWLMVIICLPIFEPLVKRGVPRWLAATAVILLAFFVLGFMGFLLYYAGNAFAYMVPEVAHELRTSATNIVSWLSKMGLDEQAASAVSSFLEPSYILSWVTYLSGMAVNVLIAFFFVVCYVIFIAADASRILQAPALYGPSAHRPLYAFSKFNSGVRRYFVVNAAFGGVVAIIDGIALWALSIPGPIVWAILAFVANFIPNIGFFIGMLPPTLLGFVVGGWPMALIVIAIYCSVNVVLQVLIQPKFISNAVNLNLTLSFFSVVFWTFILGPIGAILSVPLTLAVRALVMDTDPGARWLRWLSGDELSDVGSSSGIIIPEEDAQPEAPEAARQ